MADEQVGKILSGRVKKVSRIRRYPWKEPTELQKAIYDCIATESCGSDFFVPPDRPFYGGKKAKERRELAFEVLEALLCVRQRDMVRKARWAIEYDSLLKDIFDGKFEV